MYVIHILATEGRISLHAIVPGENGVLAHRIIDQEQPLLAHGQPFVAGLVVDVGFEQGSNLFLTVRRVRCKTDVVEVFFIWNEYHSLGQATLLLERFGYQVIKDPPVVKSMIEDFLPEV